MAKGKHYPKIPKKKQAAVGRAIRKEYHAHPEWKRSQKIAVGISIGERNKKKKR